MKSVQFKNHGRNNNVLSGRKNCVNLPIIWKMWYNSGEIRLLRYDSCEMFHLKCPNQNESDTVQAGTYSKYILWMASQFQSSLPLHPEKRRESLMYRICFLLIGFVSVENEWMKYIYLSLGDRSFISQKCTKPNSRVSTML